MAETKLVFTKADIDDFANKLKGSIMDASSSVFMPEKIIKSEDRTIVFWKDKTKTIAKWSGDTEDSIYFAFCAALAKKIYGSNSQVKKILRMTEYNSSERMRKKAEKELDDMLRERKAKEEAERPQKILDEAVNESAKKICDAIAKFSRRRLPE